MTKLHFLVLSGLLAAEILIGWGMLMVTQSSAQSAFNEEGVVKNSHNQGSQNHQSTPQPTPEPQPAAPEPLPSPPPPTPIEVQNIALTPQGQLANPPEVVKALYLTSWSGGSSSRIDYVINLAKTTEVNAVVIDVKDFSGELAYDTAVPEAALYGAENTIKVRNIEATIRRLHNEGIYVIARVTVFQDPVLAAARPDLAVKSKANKAVWEDFKGLSWIDPSAREAWNYTVSIARDAASRGFDEINFDYVRFPSDGILQDMEFPFAEAGRTRRQTMKEFFAYLDQNLQDVTISADLFGLATTSRDDLGIGQVIEDAYWHFDYVYPMVYPSHYANGYNGYAEPAEYPYEVVQASMSGALYRLNQLKIANPEESFAKLRPWLQDFDLGADYDTLMIQAQIQATKDAMGQDFAGFLLWAPTNWYTQTALLPFVFNESAYNTKIRTP